MKHAGSAALDRLEPLLAKLRKLPLKEKSRGAFYRGGKAFLHFHEHGEELFADARFAEEFERSAVTRASDRSALLARVQSALAAPKKAGGTKS